MITKNTCPNFGGINRLFLANQLAGEQNIISDANGVLDIILDRTSFEEVELQKDRGASFTENLADEAAGTAYSALLAFTILKERTELLSFERRHLRKRLMAVCLTNNGDWRVFRNLSLSRVGQSGEKVADANAFSYTLTGVSAQNATFAIADQAIWFVQTAFLPNGADTFDPAISFAGTATWRFANGSTQVGNAISVLGTAQGLNGTLQTVLIDNEVIGAGGITEVFMRQDGIAGTLRLDLLPNLITADLALNKIQALKVGTWVNNAGVKIELRDNQLTPAAQHELVQQVANLFAGASSDLQVGLLNQTDGAGNVYMPLPETVALAVLLYANFGIKIYIDSYTSTLFI